MHFQWYFWIVEWQKHFKQAFQLHYFSLFSLSPLPITINAPIQNQGDIVYLHHHWALSPSKFSAIDFNIARAWLARSELNYLEYSAALKGFCTRPPNHCLDRYIYSILNVKSDGPFPHRNLPSVLSEDVVVVGARQSLRPGEHSIYDPRNEGGLDISVRNCNSYHQNVHCSYIKALRQYHQVRAQFKSWPLCILV